MSYYFHLALNNGVKPSELSEIIRHLAFYSGWATAMSAVAVAKDVFSKRGIGFDQLPPASGELLPIDEAAEAQRAARVEQDAGPVAPGVVQYTSDLLFHDLWLRPALAPRDRSMVTVSSLIASGQVAQIPYHLNRAMDKGLTKALVSEMLTQLAFYAGWPNVFSAIPKNGVREANHFCPQLSRSWAVKESANSWSFCGQLHLRNALEHCLKSMPSVRIRLASQWC